MSSSQSSAVPHCGAQEEPSAAAREPAANMAALLSALETILRETIERFAQASGNVTENVLLQADAAHPSLIVALQDLDRLQQEFSALSKVFSHCVDSWCGVSKDGADPRDPLSAITLSDLKQRLAHRLHSESILMAAPAEVGEDDIF
jgi:hypothetical protein